MCALRTSGEAVCFGNGDVMASTTNFLLAKEASGRIFTDISLADGFACGLETDSTPYYWGIPKYPFTTDIPNKEFAKLSCGMGHCCGIKANDNGDPDKVLCWGWDERSGAMNAPNGKFEAVYAANEYTCAIKDNGEVECWGLNGENAGTGPVSPPSGSFVSMTTGDMTSCGFEEDGTITCWGANAGLIPSECKAVNRDPMNVPDEDDDEDEVDLCYYKKANVNKGRCTKSCCKKQDAGLGCTWDKPTRTCVGPEPTEPTEEPYEPTFSPTESPTRFPTALPTGSPTPPPIDLESYGDRVTHIAVTAGFRYKTCVGGLSWSNSMNKMMAEAFAGNMFGIFLDFSTERRRFGFNKDHFLNNVVAEMDVGCADGKEAFLADCQTLSEERVNANMNSAIAKFEADFSFLLENTQGCMQCATNEIPQVCEDWHSELCGAGAGTA